MSAKQMHGLMAFPEETERWHRTGAITVMGWASWLKNAPSITASLTVPEARKLAIELLQAAETAEADQ